MGTPHRIEETPVYMFDQLSDKAKETAREWYRSASVHDEWWDNVFDNVAYIGEIIGIKFARRRGSNALAIYFSGFSSQGDGACFEGSYAYAKGALAELKKERPASYTHDGTTTECKRNKELHEIARKLQDIQRKHFYKLEADCKHRGHYSHSGCMDVDVSHSDDISRDIGDAETDIRDTLRLFADWIYSTLEDEHDFIQSDEQVDEAMEANGYEFDEDGVRI